MDKSKLQFFDGNGYNLNFDWNSKKNYWEGNIYLPRISAGLYANSTIYVLEETDSVDSTGTQIFSFPLRSKVGEKITFSWDILNKFVDEFFMFNFDETYIIKDTSALHYEPNDGPECDTLIINRFDEYEVELGSELNTSPLPLHVAFSANEKYDATTYRRTLLMKNGREIIAKITYYAETVEEDERLKTWNSNLGYNITPEDTIIFYKSDIKEYKPDFKLINEKRKELMMEGHNIYPYIGSYKAIINALKFFGYSNLSIVEYWKNVNPNDENFGKIYHSSKYSLTKKETLTIGSRNIKLPNKDYKKTNALALVYTINHPTGEVDEWELPKVKEDFTYTIEEALIKLIALRNKLNKEFMPSTSRIIDIIGEANYFGIQGIRKAGSSFEFLPSSHDPELTRPTFDIFPKKYIHITEDRFFNDYILERLGEAQYAAEGDDVSKYNLIFDVNEFTLPNLNEKKIEDITDESLNPVDRVSTTAKCELYRDFYNEMYVNHTRDFIDEHPDFIKDIFSSSAKVILTSTTFKPTVFGDNLFFGYEVPDGNDADSDPDWTPTFGDFDSSRYSTPHWKIKMSVRQEDDDLKIANISKSHFEGLTEEELSTRLNWCWEGDGDEVFVGLPYNGYYDVTLEVNGVKHTEKKCIKVEPFNLEILGFYYDARELPKELKYDMDEDSDAYKYMLNMLQEMTAWAVPEHIINENRDMTMPNYTPKGELSHRGPYLVENTQEEWYLLDHINSEISLLIPNMKHARYIRNGVDVKPYTWFLLSYEYSKMAGKYQPKWTLINNTTGKSVEYEGKYLTCLLKEEGNYTVKLNLEDFNGNKYEISRNIFVVSDTANYRLYRLLKPEYDDFAERKQMIESNVYRLNSLYDLS